jgi:hypothetical protein
MAITGPNSYPPTIALFLTHWDAVNTELGAGGPLVLPGGMTRATLSGLRDDLVAFAASVQAELNDREVARGTIEISKAALLDRLSEFNRKVRGFLAHTPYATALPDVPSPSLGEGGITAPLDDMASLWATINGATIPGFTPPLLLLGGLALAAYNTNLAALKTAYSAYQTADQELRIERQRRNDVQDLAYAAMRGYRAAVQGTFAPTHALVESLPDLTPPPGSTPAAVTLSGSWNALALAADLTWSASTNPALSEYEIRMTPGPAYDPDADSVVGNVPPGTLAFSTSAGLAASGDKASFRVYVVLTTGNEAGSNTVTITRP